MCCGQADQEDTVTAGLEQGNMWLSGFIDTDAQCTSPKPVMEGLEPGKTWLLLEGISDADAQCVCGG